MKKLSLLPLILLAACSSAPEAIELPERITSTEVPVEANDWAEARSEVLRTFAFRALEKGLIEEARGYLQEACDLDERDAQSHITLARLYLAEGDVRASLAYAERAAHAHPENAQANLVYAAALAENNHLEKANRVLENTWKRSENDPSMARVLITHYAADAGSDAAHAFVKQMLLERPASASAWVAAGDLFLADGALDESADAYRRALKLDSSLKTPRSLASRLGQNATSEDPVLHAAAKSEKDGDYAAAERLLRFLHSSKPTDSEAQIALARVLWRQSRLAEAEQLLETVSESAKNWQVALLEAKVAISSKKWEKAQGSLLLSRQLRPGLRATELLLTYVQEQIAEEKAVNMPKDL